MFIKWIVCNVIPGETSLFSKCQEDWNALRYVGGFRGQIGGWDVKHSRSACIMGLWESQEAYQAFMRDFHDRIFCNSSQGETYDSIHINLSFGRKEFFEGGKTIAQNMSKGKVLCVSKWSIKPDQNEYFLEQVFPVWRQKLCKGNGFLGGLISQEKEKMERLLLITLWSKMKPGSIRLPEVDEGGSIVQKREERMVLLKESWCVIPC
ncbi:DUF4937 domain-containing protein [Melghirimyces algeriensis]|uniref:DUF4937 domain-containing protein n=1 Tax=Melghirimyces algeriensis TaxID=910412 RepID=A0A521AWI2_9BACL|nr:DUF4937 domain-containing protein [Melghirimyces algeriensis]SMO39188.1 protein of unknown function [Melghirimyces algeriensis]